MAFVDEKFMVPRVSLLQSLSGGGTQVGLATSLGSDFQHAMAPFQAEILALARYLQGDVHRAAMRLLVERNGRRPSAMEQQLIIAALAELQSTRSAATTSAARETRLERGRLVSRPAPTASVAGTPGS